MQQDDAVIRAEYDRQYAFVAGFAGSLTLADMLNLLSFMLRYDQEMEGNWGAIDAVSDAARRVMGRHWLKVGMQ
jgi:hypothetical protein